MLKHVYLSEGLCWKTRPDWGPKRGKTRTPGFLRPVSHVSHLENKEQANVFFLYGTIVSCHKGTDGGIQHMTEGHGHFWLLPVQNRISATASTTRGP